MKNADCCIENKRRYMHKKDVKNLYEKYGFYFLEQEGYVRII